MSDLHADIVAVIRDVFDDPDIALTPASTAADVDGWDSLMHLNVVVAIEKRFGVRFTTAEISGMKEQGQTFGDLVALVRSKTGAGA